MGLPLTPTCVDIIKGMHLYGFFPIFFSFACILVVPLLCESTQAAYGFARTMAIFFMASWLLIVQQKNSFEAMDHSFFLKLGTNAKADYSQKIGNTWSNVFLMFIFTWLFYGPVLYYDYSLKAALEEVVEGTAPPSSAGAAAVVEEAAAKAWTTR